MKRIMITIIAIIAILLALYLAAYGPWRTGGRQVEKDSAGGLNVAQDNNHPVTDTKDVKQPVKDVQQPVNEVKQRVTNAHGAKRHGKGAKRSMTGGRHVKQQGADPKHQVIETRADYGASGCIPLRCEDLKLQVIEAPEVKRLTITVMQPTEDIEAVSVKIKRLSVEPMDMEDIKDSSDWSPAREINLAFPERQKCPTPYKVWIGLSVR